MCGRLTQSLSSEELATLFDALDAADEPGGRYNVAPTQPLLAVVEQESQRVLTRFRWGLIPPWAKDMTIGAKLINARGETVREKPSFRSSFRRQRCIVPADAFYEWQKVGTSKVPHAIRRVDGRPLALAGLWSSWRNPETPEPLQTCCVITTAPNELMAPLHDRMPAILGEDAWNAWLDPTFQDGDALQDLLQPCPAEWLTAYPVTRAVNDVRRNGPELLAPATR